jgi:hypothetical protein
MSYVFGRLQRQLIHGLSSSRLALGSGCRAQTGFVRRRLRPACYVCPTARAASTAEFDQTEPGAKAKKLDQKALEEQEQEVRVRQRQVQRPWHRQGADEPPVDKDGNEVAPITKG